MMCLRFATAAAPPHGPTGHGFCEKGNVFASKFCFLCVWLKVLTVDLCFGLQFMSLFDLAIWVCLNL